MRRNQFLLSKTSVSAIFLLALWGAALVGMTALRNNSADAVTRVFEPSGLVVSRQDMSGRTVFFRELRAAAPASRFDAIANDGRC